MVASDLLIRPFAVCLWQKEMDEIRLQWSVQGSRSLNKDIVRETPGFMTVAKRKICRSYPQLWVSGGCHRARLGTETPNA